MARRTRLPYTVIAAPAITVLLMATALCEGTKENSEVDVAAGDAGLLTVGNDGDEDADSAAWVMAPQD